MSKSSMASESATAYITVEDEGRHLYYAFHSCTTWKLHGDHLDVLYVVDGTNDAHYVLLKPGWHVRIAENPF